MKMYEVPLLNMPGFISMNQGEFRQLFFEYKQASELYDLFKADILNALIEKRYLPVMRMCDGEYIYCVGKKRNSNLTGFRALKFYAGKILKGHVTSWGEKYTRKQNKILKKNFPELLKKISAHGYIANHFVYSPVKFCEEYIEPMRKWFTDQVIGLNTANFTAFYFVYTLLNGPDSLIFFKNRSILILSSFEKAKQDKVEKELKRRGASNVYFKAISPTQSMVDELDLSDYKGKVEIGLIAGGIGSANILAQCHPLNIVCIDSGFCLECIADKSKRQERPFCLPDIEF